MLLPWPILLALFFVFQNTIELRGQSFLWLPDLSLKDPLFILPVLMGLSLFAVSKVGMIGMAPNPQMKTMLYVMPVMMTVMFLNFASGLNLYYFVQNVGQRSPAVDAGEGADEEPAAAGPAARGPDEEEVRV